MSGEASLIDWEQLPDSLQGSWNTEWPTECCHAATDFADGYDRCENRRLADSDWCPDHDPRPADEHQQWPAPPAPFRPCEVCGRESIDVPLAADEPDGLAQSVWLCVWHRFGLYERVRKKWLGPKRGRERTLAQDQLDRFGERFQVPSGGAPDDRGSSDSTVSLNQHAVRLDPWLRKAISKAKEHQRRSGDMPTRTRLAEGLHVNERTVWKRLKERGFDRYREFTRYVLDES